MLIEQDGLCKICSKELYLFSPKKSTTAHVDHDHKTGKVRGLLCQECNTGLGKFNDNVGLFYRAIEYLKNNS